MEEKCMICENELENKFRAVCNSCQEELDEFLAHEEMEKSKK